MLLSRFTIIGHSMEPTLMQGQTILVSSIPYLFSNPNINHIVAFEEQKTGKVLIKRIVKINTSSEADKYFVKGDNENDSIDSRQLGWIEKKEIMGKVIYKMSNLL